MAEPLVLLAGPLMDARVFLPQTMALGDLAALILPRRINPGTIESMAETLLAEAPAKFALFGHGTGGMVAMEVLRRAPDRLTRLILASTDALPDPPAVSVSRENSVVHARAGRYEQVMAKDPAIVDYLGRGDCDDLAGLLFEMLETAGPEGFAAHVRALQRRPDQQKTLRTSRLPVMLMGGAADPVHSPRRMELLAGLIAGSKLVLVPNAGHLLTLEAPDAVNAALREFLSAPLPAPARAEPAPRGNGVSSPP